MDRSEKRRSFKHKILSYSIYNTKWNIMENKELKEKFVDERKGNIGKYGRLKLNSNIFL